MYASLAIELPILPEDIYPVYNHYVRGMQNYARELGDKPCNPNWESMDSAHIDQQMVERAIINNSESFDAVPSRFITHELCKLAAYHAYSKDFMDDYISLVKTLTDENEGVCPFTHEEMYEIAMIIICQFGRALYFVPEEFKTREMCEIAVAKAGFMINSVPEHILDYDLCLRGVAHSNKCHRKYAFSFVPDKWKPSIDAEITRRGLW